ncbi:hypothetical protein CEXT_542071 [Caerostris extrusa]|uniref:Uncharacterized protein n=1 Tax=Caerostris extrusa TaxID=172846 RepID=A0AAV4PGS8_CAEEX|nr:hypothetical protein CEXT_542071 [Caerostris extrusa]
MKEVSLEYKKMKRKLPRFTKTSLVAEEFDKWHLGEEQEKKKNSILRNNNRPLYCSTKNCQKGCFVVRNYHFSWPCAVCANGHCPPLAQLAESNFFVCSDNGKEGPCRHQGVSKTRHSGCANNGWNGSDKQPMILKHDGWPLAGNGKNIDNGKHYNLRICRAHVRHFDQASVSSKTHSTIDSRQLSSVLTSEHLNVKAKSESGLQREKIAILKCLL